MLKLPLSKNGFLTKIIFEVEKLKSSQMKVFLILGLFFLLVNANPRPVAGWGLISHQFIVEESMQELDDDWKAVFNALISKFKSGSIYPDSLHGAGDTPNHLYYPGNDSGTTAPQAVERYYNYFVGNLSVGNYADAVFSAGVFGHYMADVNIPVHTDAYWDGHPAYETDINQQLANLVLGPIIIDTDIPDIKEYVKSAAASAHPYYDDIVNAYPDGTVSNVILTNSTIKTITENQITHAISNVASLLLKGIGEAVPPIIKVVAGSNALIDYAHGNDYATGSGSATYKLGGYENFLISKGFSVTKNNDTFTTNLLKDYNFLVITAFETDFTTDELTAISNWLDSGKRSIFVTGRGDYQSYSHVGINDLLNALGSSIRVNDDNVYTIASEPGFYKEHYVYTDVVTTPPGESYPNDAVVYHSYAPNSLYFEGSTSEVTVLVNGSKYDYQSEINAPLPAKIWDDTNDGEGGTAIPLVASEKLSGDDDRIVVFGATDFSDFSFGTSGFHDDEFFIPVFTKWVLFGTLGEGIFYLPNLKILTTGTSFSNGEVTLDYEVSDNVIEVQLLVNGVVKGTATTKPFTQFKFSSENGSFNVTIVAKTISEKQISKSISVTVTGATSSSSSQSASIEFLFAVPLPIILVLFLKKKKLI